MAEQSYESHAHRPVPTNDRRPLRDDGAGADDRLLVFRLADARLGHSRGDRAVFGLGAISRLYTVNLQDRIIMLEIKVRCAEVLPAGQDANLAGCRRSRSSRFALRQTRSSARCSSGPSGRTSRPRTSRPRSRPGVPTCIAPDRPMTPEEQEEVRRLIEAHERTLQICRACAETTRDLAWEVKRGSLPPARGARRHAQRSRARP